LNEVSQKENVLGGLTTISAERTSPGIFERHHGKVQQIVFGEFEPARLLMRTHGHEASESRTLPRSFAEQA